MGRGWGGGGREEDRPREREEYGDGEEGSRPSNFYIPWILDPIKFPRCVDTPHTLHVMFVDPTPHIHAPHTSHSCTPH